jgi:hypothetical protein
VLAAGWLYVAALLASFIISMLASPAGVSGAVLLLPFQVTVLGTPSPAVTPTNLLYNVVATPGALYRYRRQGQTGGALTRVLVLGTLPGVIAGSVVRVELLPGARPFELVIALVMVPLGGSLLVRQHRPAVPAAPTNPLVNPTDRVPGATKPAAVWSPSAHDSAGGRSPARTLSPARLVVMAMAVGCIGGIYGIGGGSILAPVLIRSGRPASEVAPATLASTLVTSVAGVITFLVLSTQHAGSVAPDWSIGIALGAGGLVGGYVGARLQPRLPEVTIRQLLGVLVMVVGVRYGWLAARG